MKKWGSIYLFCATCILSTAGFEAFGDTTRPTLPHESEVGQGYQKAYRKLMREKQTTEAMKKVITEEITPALTEQGKALKKKRAEPSVKKPTASGESAVKKKSEKAGFVGDVGPGSPRNMAPIIEEQAPEIDVSNLPGMIIFEKGKEPVVYPQDNTELPGQIEFTGSKDKKGAFD